jgi:hypothetical protein
MESVSQNNEWTMRNVKVACAHHWKGQYGDGDDLTEYDINLSMVLTWIHHLCRAPQVIHVCPRALIIRNYCSLFSIWSLLSFDEHEVSYEHHSFMG